MRPTPITRLPHDLWNRAHHILLASPVIAGRQDQHDARAAVLHELQRGSISGLRDALTDYCMAYSKDIEGRLIPLARNYFLCEASALGQDIDHWQAGIQSKEQAA